MFYGLRPFLLNSWSLFCIFNIVKATLKHLLWKHWLAWDMFLFQSISASSIMDRVPDYSEVAETLAGGAWLPGRRFFIANPWFVHLWAHLRNWNSSLPTCRRRDSGLDMVPGMLGFRVWILEVHRYMAHWRSCTRDSTSCLPLTFTGCSRLWVI